MSVKSAERVLLIFELLANNTEGLTIKEISEKLTIPQSSTSNLVRTLLQAGYLTQDSLKRYQLGPKLIQIGTVAMDSLDISSQGRPYLKKLMEEVEETVFMAVLSGKELVYVAKIDSDRSIRTTAQPGYRKPLYCTGLGKTFLAFLPEPDRKALLDEIKLTPITPKTITDRETLETQLETFAEQGYAVDDEENEEGLFCLAAPIFGADHKIQAAISVAGPRERMLHRKEQIIEKLSQTALIISKNIGYSHALHK
jgi:DNA-binding IclR family transcriptional regulator